MVRQRRTQSSSLIANTPYLNTLLTFEAEISTISQNNYHSINRSVPEGSGLVSRRRRRRGRTDPVGKFGTTSTRGALPAAHNGCPPSDHSSTAGTPSRHQLKSGGGGPERRSAAVPAAVAKDSSFSLFRPSPPHRRRHGKEQWRRRWRQRPAFAVPHGEFPAGGEEARQEPFRPHRYVRRTRASLSLMHAAPFGAGERGGVGSVAVPRIQGRGIVILWGF